MTWKGFHQSMGFLSKMIKNQSLRDSFLMAFESLAYMYERMYILALFVCLLIAWPGGILCRETRYKISDSWRISSRYRMAPLLLYNFVLVNWTLPSIGTWQLVDFSNKIPSNKLMGYNFAAYVFEKPQVVVLFSVQPDDEERTASPAKRAMVDNVNFRPSGLYNARSIM